MHSRREDDLFSRSVEQVGDPIVRDVFAGRQHSAERRTIWYLCLYAVVTLAACIIVDHFSLPTLGVAAVAGAAGGTLGMLAGTRVASRRLAWRRRLAHAEISPGQYHRMTTGRSQSKWYLLASLAFLAAVTSGDYWVNGTINHIELLATIMILFVVPFAFATERLILICHRMESYGD